jgi:putative transposase
MNHVKTLHTSGVPLACACLALAVPRSSFYRLSQATEAGAESASVQEQRPKRLRPKPPRALSSEERKRILDILNSDRFCDQTPREIYATLLDEGVYYAHWRSFYRLLKEHRQVRERRQAVRTPQPIPQLTSTAPCQVWSWDITKLRGPRGVFFQLYVIIDIFSRYVVGWTLARHESKEIAAELIEATCKKQQIRPQQLVLHADRGGAMRSATVSELLERLGVERSHSRPRVSDDNPFSEAQFKTLKYMPQFPERFLSEEMAWTFLGKFFDWYNKEHHHTGVALLTPATVHWGKSEERLAHRDDVLAKAYAARPERFVRGTPRALRPPTVVSINPAGEPSKAALAAAGSTGAVLGVEATEHRDRTLTSPGARVASPQSPILRAGDASLEQAEPRSKMTGAPESEKSRGTKSPEIRSEADVNGLEKPSVDAH